MSSEKLKIFSPSETSLKATSPIKKKKTPIPWRMALSFRREIKASLNNLFSFSNELIVLVTSFLSTNWPVLCLVVLWTALFKSKLTFLYCRSESVHKKNVRMTIKFHKWPKICLTFPIHPEKQPLLILSAIHVEDDLSHRGCVSPTLVLATS